MSNDVTPYPKDNSFSESNWSLLAGFWYPIAYSSDLGTRPVAVRLLDQRLVAYRAAGQVVVANDVCIHRGAPLSGGRIVKDTLECPYHGLRFDGTGKCVAIPPAGPNVPIPPKLRLATYPVAERYGIVWTCLQPEPRAPLPEWPPMDDPKLQKVKLKPADWNCSAFRHVENFNDVAHFSYVHAGTFGNPDEPQVPRYEVVSTEHGLERSLAVNQIDRDTFTQGGERAATMQYKYAYTLPFNSSLTISSPDGRNEYIYDAVCPVSSGKSRIFILKARDYDLDQPVDEWIEFQHAVNEEDRWIVEAQHPEEIPMDLRVEAHILADAWSIAFRRRWAGLGYTDH
ncbi:aromatic ring-hydroxylating dioxygenase subunit alpha [Pseudaminobacter sp. NGMCC 1.201702]|uniref:aromatic ring-hydroxylating dioxygenase subunit alpha n=1 Tax=Pseudaminobacter sp. NGMCC 1.201702 TaxID=3391825 RepID=UPI0039EF59EA